MQASLSYSGTGTAVRSIFDTLNINTYRTDDRGSLLKQVEGILLFYKFTRCLKLEDILIICMEACHWWTFSLWTVTCSDCRGGVEKGVLLVIEGYTDNISCQQIGFKLWPIRFTFT